MPDLKTIQQRVETLTDIALREPDSNEGRTAAVKALSLIREHGLLVVRRDELVTFVVAPSAAPLTKPKRTRSRRKVAEVVTETADGITTTLDAASRVAASVNSFVSVFRR